MYSIGSDGVVDFEDMVHMCDLYKKVVSGNDGQAY